MEPKKCLVVFKWNFMRKHSPNLLHTAYHDFAVLFVRLVGVSVKFFNAIKREMNGKWIRYRYSDAKMSIAAHKTSVFLFLLLLSIEYL